MLTNTNKLLPLSFSHNQKWTDEGIEFMPGNNGMMWGPYIHLEAGNYVCHIQFVDIKEYLESVFTYDICADYGRKILVDRSSPTIDEQGFYINLVLREPEDNIEFRLYHSGEQGAIFSSFQISRCDNQSMEMLADTFLIERSESLFKQAPRLRADPENKSFHEVRILQTADANRYSEILAASSIINKAYCQRWGLNHEAFSGIIFGEKPFQAMYNRTALLWFLFERGYRGWVLYLDADAAVSDFVFDFKSYLVSKRNEGKYLVFHPVFDEGHPSQFFGNINNGVFAVDLSSPIGCALISVWHSFYREFYTQNDFAKAKQWTDLLDDQSCLQRILFINRKFLKPHIAFESIQHSYVFQALRSDDTNESSEDDLERRKNLLHELGIKIGVYV